MITNEQQASETVLNLRMSYEDIELSVDNPVVKAELDNVISLVYAISKAKNIYGNNELAFVSITTDSILMAFLLGRASMAEELKNKVLDHTKESGE